MTTKKNLITAAQYITFRLGVLEKSWAISDKCGIAWQQTLEAINPYITRATEMVELGEETAMSKPDHVEIVVYHEFGDDWGRFMREHGRLPDEQEANDLLVHVLTNAFGPVMNNVQKDSFRAKLQAMAGDEDGDD